MSKIPIHDAYGRIVGYDQDSTAFGKLDLDMEDHGHLINEATEHIDKLNSEITRLTRELELEKESHEYSIAVFRETEAELLQQLAEARKTAKGYDLRLGDDFGDDPIELVVFLKSKLAEARKEKVCKWEWDEDDKMGGHETGCGCFYIHEKQHDFIFCPYCGGRIE